MNETPSDLKFLDSHEWIKEDDNTVIVGISDHAQNELGEVVFVELPAIGDEFVEGDEAAVVESVKAASEVYTPISGELPKYDISSRLIIVSGSTPGSIWPDKSAIKKSVPESMQGEPIDK